MVVFLLRSALSLDARQDSFYDVTENKERDLLLLVFPYAERRRQK